MRDILFRGIPKDDIDRHFFTDTWKENCEGSFVYGSLVVAHDRYYICVSALCAINSCVNNGMTSMIEVIPETVGQYTGLCDKNGKKIFEGDIIKGAWGVVVQVVYDECYLGFLARNDMLFQHGIDYYGLDKIEVIGNIHDNPELLKGGVQN